MIVAFVAIGMLSGIGAAVPTDYVFADGNTCGYYAEYEGTNGGYISINTYTPDGEDHKSIEFDADMSGWQTVEYDCSTLIDREDRTDGGFGTIDSYTEDNYGAVVASFVTSTSNTKLWQDAYLSDDDCVHTDTHQAANAEYSMGVMGTNNGGEYVSITLVGSGHGVMMSDAWAEGSYGAEIEFGVEDDDRGYGGTYGDGEFYVNTQSDDEYGLGVTGPNEWYLDAYSGGMEYIAPFSGATTPDNEFIATGYVYAIDY